LIPFFNEKPLLILVLLIVIVVIAFQFKPVKQTIMAVVTNTTNKYKEKRFLLFQGNTLNQSVHLLKNLDDTSISPWYELKLNSEISIPGYTFANSKFVRFK